ncbi:MAG: hypothetical protein ACREMY_10170, partial [bacterium]
PYLERIENADLRRILILWHKRNPNDPDPLVRLLKLAEGEKRYPDAVALVREGDVMKILDPEYARLRLRVLFRSAEQLLGSGKRGAAALLLDEVAGRPEDLNDGAGTWLLALRWAAATPDKAGDLLAELAKRGVPGEIVMAEITGDLDLPYALPSSRATAADLLEGVRLGVKVLNSAGRIARHCAWLVERTEPYLERATEAQLMSIGSAAFVLKMIPLAWQATARALAISSSMLQRPLLLRAEILLQIKADPRRTLLVIEAARILAQNAHDTDMVRHAAELAHSFPYRIRGETQLEPDEIDAIVERERTGTMPALRGASRGKKTRKKAPPKKLPDKRPPMAGEKGLFEP